MTGSHERLQCSAGLPRAFDLGREAVHVGIKESGRVSPGVWKGGRNTDGERCMKTRD